MQSNDRSSAGAEAAAEPRFRIRGLWIAGAIAAIVLVAAAAAGGWYLFLRPSGPPPVDINALVVPASAGTSTATSGATSTGSSTVTAASSSGAAAADSTASSATSAGLDGTWKVNTSIGSGSSGSFVGYRVQEQLASIGANTAVGRTSAVSGSFTLQGTTVTAASITADLTQLVSDDPRRDGQLTHLGLQTSTYPTATFVLTQPIALGTLPADGSAITTKASGTLTLHGVTRTVEITLQAKRSGSVIAVTGSLPITFADYGIQAPTSFFVLSVADHGTMELQMLFTHA